MEGVCICSWSSICSSLSAQIGSQLCSHVVVGSVCSVAGLLLKSWVPTVELVEAVAEAKALLNGQEHQVRLLCALGEAAFVEGLSDHSVFLGHWCKIILCTELRRLNISFLDCEVSQALISLGNSLGAVGSLLLFELSNVNSAIREELLHSGVSLFYHYMLVFILNKNYYYKVI